MSNITVVDAEVFIGGNKVGVSASDDAIGALGSEESGIASKFGKAITIQFVIDGDHKRLIKLLALDAVKLRNSSVACRDDRRGPRNRWGGLK